MNITESDEFKRDFKKLAKKYKTLETDFVIAKKAIVAEPRGDGTKHWDTLWKDDGRCIMKMRMMCRAVKGSSFRLVYRFDGEEAEVLFIEVFYKGNKEREDKERVKKYIDEMERTGPEKKWATATRVW